MNPRDLECFQQTFEADDVWIDFLPNFDGPALNLISCHKKVGPFQAGLPCRTPLWLARSLHSKSLGTWVDPSWMTVENLRQIIHFEKTNAELSKELPFEYYSVGKRLTEPHNPTVALLLEDLLECRVDKLRHQFQGILKEKSTAMDQPPELLVTVTGIGQTELALLRNVVTKALEDRALFVEQAKIIPEVGEENLSQNIPQSSRTRMPIRRFRK